ncbi:hypothetical protein SAY87_006852 [Trapa incisa]|uniref:Uncharacterized protein n=1 Tax=Trapa incisa TaxID=236973 RepID=A0AAN7Q4M6_9MYRT|nr:hypothetical protein SAY87_006852 [Trapa incisa]
MLATLPPPFLLYINHPYHYITHPPAMLATLPPPFLLYINQFTFGRMKITKFDKVDRVKGSWSHEEDAALMKLVDQHGPRNWSLISTSIPGRTGKSCRLRWCNQLSPTVHHRPFTLVEDQLILEAHRAHGNKWATIARLLRGRTDNSIRNHWNSTLHRQYLRNRSTPYRTTAAVKRSLSPLPGDTEGFSSESAKWQRLVRYNGNDRGFEDKIRTSLTLSMPWEGGLGVTTSMMDGDRESETGGSKEVEAGNNIGNNNNTVKHEMEDKECLVTIMKRMIAEEVRKCIDGLQVQKNGHGPNIAPQPGPDIGPSVRKDA